MTPEQVMLLTAQKLQALIDQKHIFHASVNVWPRVILDLHEEEWAMADPEIKQFVKDNSIVVETWT